MTALSPAKERCLNGDRLRACTEWKKERLAYAVGKL